MARITIGLGFLRTPDQEKAWRRATAALPEDWAIVMVGSSTTGIFDVRVESADFKASKTFGPNGSDAVLRYLDSLKQVNKP
jgi:hypothetical protein